MRNPLRYHLEYWATLAAFRTLPALPRPVMIRLSYTLGFLGYIGSRKLRRIGMVNLDIAFGNSKTAKQKKQILRSSFRNMALVLLDSFWFSRDTQKRLDRLVTLDESFQCLLQEKAHVGITAHFGNWEVFGLAITNLGFPLNSVAKPLKNDRVDKLFSKVRQKNGQLIIPRNGAVRTMLRLLKEGKKIGLVMDQNTRISEGGEMVPFFSLKAPFATAAAALAIKTGSNIAIGTMIPRPDGGYHGDVCIEIDVAPFLEGDIESNTSALTHRIAEKLEAIIKEKPQFWLWSYKRWKYVPEGEDPARYPFYQRELE